MLLESEKIKSELAKVGIIINDIYDLVNTKKSYQDAIPVLLKLIEEGIEHPGIKEGVIRALAVKEAVGKTGRVLIAEFNRIPKDKVMLRWAIGNTIFMTITEEDVESILTIIHEKTNGISRQMFVAALGKMKSEKSEKALIKLLDDEEVAPHALEALGKMKSKAGMDKILTLTNHPRSLIRKEARKTLKIIS